MFPHSCMKLAGRLLVSVWESRWKMIRYLCIISFHCKSCFMPFHLPLIIIDHSTKNQQKNEAAAWAKTWKDKLGRKIYNQKGNSPWKTIILLVSCLTFCKALQGYAVLVSDKTITLGVSRLAVIQNKVGQIIQTAQQVRAVHLRLTETVGHRQSARLLGAQKNL